MIIIVRGKTGIIHNYYSSNLLIFIAICVLMMISSCKKDNTDNPDNKTDPDPAEIYENQGYGYLGRYDTYTPDVPGSYYISPLDLRIVNNKLHAVWMLDDAFYGSTQIYSGILENKKFNKTDYSPCGDASVNSDYRKVLNYEIDGQGNLFVSYRYRMITSSYPTWYHIFCSSSGLTSNGEQVEYPLTIRENNMQVTAAGATVYNGYETTGLKHYKFSYTSWEKFDIPALKPDVQGWDYYVSENGNSYLAYTDAPQGDQTTGNMNLSGNDGVSWVNLGSAAAGEVRKLVVNFYEPFEVRMIRNGDNPFIILYRDNGTIAVFRFDGTVLQPVADNVIFPDVSSAQFTTIAHPEFCIFNNKLTTFGFGNSSGAVDNTRAVYQLNGSSFTELKTVDADNITIRGVFSDNSRLYVACEVFRANNGIFTSPVDIIEIK